MKSYSKIFSILIVYIFPLFAVPTELQLHKAFHHRYFGQTQPLATDLDIARIELQFASKFKEEKEEQGSNAGFKKLVIRFPSAAINGTEGAAIDKALNYKLPGYYEISVRTQASPKKMIELSLLYDPKKIMVKTAHYDAITGAPSYELRLLNEPLLTMLSKKKNINVLQTAQLKPTIIIDCGHGGHDCGTKHCNAAEKDITLAVGKQLYAQLSHTDYTVIMTRTDDRFVSLDQRTSLANQLKNNALLISLHVNHAQNPAVRGLEIFCSVPQLFINNDFSLRTALDIIDDHDQKLATASYRLADTVKKSILSTMTHQGYEMVDRKIKHAAAQVLLGVAMPSILIEMEFLSNPTAAKLLTSDQFQKDMATAIASGVRNYLHS